MLPQSIATRHWLTPRSFTRLSEVMELQSRHLFVLLVRSPNLSSPKRFTRQRSTFSDLSHLPSWICVVWTVANWLTILATVAMLLGGMPEYIEIVGSTIHLGDYFVRFKLATTATFLLTEWFCFSTISDLRSHRSPELVVLRSLGRTLDSELGRRSVQRLTRFFTRAYNTVWYYLMIIALALVGSEFRISRAVIRAYLSSEHRLSLLEVPGFIVYSGWAYGYGFNAAVIWGHFMVHLFLMVGVFKCKSIACKVSLLRLLAQTKTSGGSKSTSLFDTGISTFQHRYLSLHGELCAYNHLSSRFIAYCDLGFKVAGSIMLSIFLHVSDQVTSSLVILLLLVMLAIAYALMQAVMFTLAYFPAQNILCYKLLASIAALAAKASGRPCVKSQASPFTSGSGAPPALLRRGALRLDSMVEFMGHRGNRFGFSYGPLYMIGRMNTVESISMNGYLVLLFYKHFTRSDVA